MANTWTRYDQGYSFVDGALRYDVCTHVDGATEGSLKVTVTIGTNPVDIYYREEGKTRSVQLIGDEALVAEHLPKMRAIPGLPGVLVDKLLEIERAELE